MPPSGVRSQLLAELREKMRAVEAIDPTTLSVSRLRSLFSDTARMFSAIAARPEASSSGVHGMPFGALPFVPPVLAPPALALPSTSADLRDPRFSTPRTLESRRAARSGPEDDKPLPFDLLALVLSLLEAEDLGRFQRVSRHWSEVVNKEVVPKRFQLLADLGTRGRIQAASQGKIQPEAARAGRGRLPAAAGPPRRHRPTYVSLSK